ncbi:hypothetical protein DPMN_185545 [Dreissena polymorpha]|uniref:Uncharacterized protein n=1 Tax=Dreissena polymorpha TaxID=45954 RepID=A0A9D4DKL1_DREPO|nr:hypothetical protein DPMN_185545 [Dreissena polymorpha]
MTQFRNRRGIIRTNVLSKFHEDRKRNVASRVFTRPNVDDARRTEDGQKAIPKAHHEHVVLRGIKLGPKIDHYNSKLAVDRSSIEALYKAVLLYDKTHHRNKDISKTDGCSPMMLC